MATPAGDHDSPSQPWRLGLIAVVLLTTPIGLFALPLAALLGLLIAAGLVWAGLERLCTKYPTAALGVVGVLLLVTSPLVVFPLLLHQPPASWHVLMTTLVVVVFFVWPLVQRLCVDPLRAAATDRSDRDTPTAAR
jgi:hypothetical protein